MAKKFRRLCLKIGAAMLFHHVMINVVTSGVSLLLEILHEGGWWEERTYTVIYELIYGAMYLLSFMLPVAFFRLLSRRDEPVSMGMEPTMPWKSLLFVPAVIGVNLGFAYLNHLLMLMLELIGIPNILNMITETYVYPEEYVLLHMTVSLVPAFCEEFLFRGLICARLRPYGKTVAIVGSAVLFGLMHGNLGQLLYTTAAGVMLGWCFVETGSIWPGVIAHMLNNLLGVISEYWYAFLPDEKYMLYDSLLTLSLGFLAAICLVWIFALRRRTRDDSPVLGLGNTRALPDRTRRVLTAGQRWRGFFSPTLVVYYILAFGSIVSFILLGIFSEGAGGMFG